MNKKILKSTVALLGLIMVITVTFLNASPILQSDLNLNLLFNVNNAVAENGHDCYSLTNCDQFKGTDRNGGCCKYTSDMTGMKSQ